MEQASIRPVLRIVGRHAVVGVTDVRVSRKRSERECLEACLTCECVCRMAWTQSQRDGAAAGGDLPATLIDCAELCAFAVVCILRSSSVRGYVCDACAELCDRSATMLAEQAHAMSELLPSTTACRICAEACRRYAMAWNNQA